VTPSRSESGCGWIVLVASSLVVVYGLWFFAGLLGGGSTPVT